MGFLDINAFNLVMLAKHAWHLIHGPHSLFYHVYKARYFPTCSFLDAELETIDHVYGGVYSKQGTLFGKALYGKLGMVTLLGLKAINGYLNPKLLAWGRLELESEWFV